MGGGALAGCAQTNGPPLGLCPPRSPLGLVPASPSRPPRYAYCAVIWGANGGYALGAAALGARLRELTEAEPPRPRGGLAPTMDRVLLHTDDVPENFLRVLSEVRAVRRGRVPGGPLLPGLSLSLALPLCDDGVLGEAETGRKTRSYPRVAEQLLSPRVPKSSLRRSQRAPQLYREARFGQNSTEICRVGRMFGRCWPNLANFCNACELELDRIRRAGPGRQDSLLEDVGGRRLCVVPVHLDPGASVAVQLSLVKTNMALATDCGRA